MEGTKQEKYIKLSFSHLTSKCLVAGMNHSKMHWPLCQPSTTFIQCACLNSTNERWELGLKAEAKVAIPQVAACCHSVFNKIYQGSSMDVRAMYM